MKQTAPSVFKRLSNDFADPSTEVHAALPIFTNYNKFLQRNDPLPHKVLPMTKSLARKIADSREIYFT